MRSQDCSTFETSHFDDFERMCGTNLLPAVQQSKKLTIIIVDNY